MKSPENKNQLIVDEAVSEYVQMIFSMYKDGFSIGRIAKRCLLYTSVHPAQTLGTIISMLIHIAVIYVRCNICLLYTSIRRSRFRGVNPI